MRGAVRELSAAGRDARLFLWFNLLAFVAWGVFNLVFNLYLRVLGLNEDAMGVFAAVQTLGMAAGGAAVGPLFVRQGMWRCLVGGVTLFALSGFALAFVSSFPAIVAFGALTGVGIAAPFTATMPFVMEAAPAERRQVVAAFAFALLGLSMTLGSLLGGLLPDMLHQPPVIEYRWTLVAGVAVAAFSLVPLLLMSPARRHAHARGRAARERQEDAAALAQGRRDGGLFVLMAGMLALGFGALLPFYNVYLASLGMEARTIGLIYALAGVCQSAAGLAAPAIIRRYGTLWVTAGLRVAPLPLFAALLLAPSGGLATAAYVFRAALFGPTIPAESQFVAEILPESQRHHVFGLRVMSWNVAWAVGSAAAGWAIVRAGYAPVIVVFIVAMIAANALYVIYVSRHPPPRNASAPPMAAPPSLRRVIDVIGFPSIRRRFMLAGDSAGRRASRRW
ncbi:MAG: MFS transporter [Chloroflexota bacterium]